MKYLTNGQVAKFCGVSPRTASKWFDSGMLAGHKIPISGDRRIEPQSLLVFMERHRIPVPDELRSLCQKT